MAPEPSAPGVTDVLAGGGVIGVCGPDGVGKTTLCEALVRELSADGEVLHVRFPGLLPRRDPVKRREARLGTGVDPAALDPVAFPERAYAPLYSTPKSVAKTLYLFVDFVLGWACNVRPLVRSGGWVVFERGWWDHAVDARRYRLRSPGLIRALGRLLPSWDLILVLDAPPETIRARKPELPVEEIRRQSRAWRELLPARQRRAFLDASRPAAEVLARARAEIAAATSTRRRARGRARPRRGGRGVGSAVAPRPAGAPWVVVTDGPRNRSALAAVRSLATAGYRPAVASPGRSLAGASRACARRIPVPDDADPGYTGALRALEDSGDYLAVLPASDAAAVALNAPGSHLLDKEMLARLAADAGLATPPARVFGSVPELVATAGELDYPLAVKPTSARGVPRRVEDAAQLRNLVLPDRGPVVVQPFVDEALRAVSGIAWGGELAASVHQRYLRIWPLQVGTVCAAITVAPDPDLDAKLARLLAGHNCIFQAQFIGPYLLDLHPRVHGSMPLADAAGVNLPGLYCDLLRGLEVPRPEARLDVLYRWLEADLAHIAAAWRGGRMSTGEALVALRPRRRTAHSTESLADPGPMLARLRRRG